MPLLTTLKHANSKAAASAAQSIVLSASMPVAEEGDTVNFYLSVPLDTFPAGTLFPYTITGITQADLFYGTLTGNFTIDANGYAQASIILARDSEIEVETITLTLDGDYSEYSATVTIVDGSSAPIGEVLYSTPGTYSWTCPVGVYSVSAVCIGGGGDGAAGGYTNPSQVSFGGGGGGGLGYRNNIAVTPGITYTVVVGNHGSLSGDSYFISRATVQGRAGASGYYISAATSTKVSYGGSWVGDGGGNGGNSGGLNQAGGYLSGAGGAGGYGSDGGVGGSWTSTTTLRSGGNSTYGGGGGTVGLYYYSAGYQSYTGSSGRGGGVGAYGRGGSQGLGAVYNYEKHGADGGSYNTTVSYGAGGGAEGYSSSENTYKTHGSTGAVRIMWGGERSFPSNAPRMSTPTGITTTLTQTYISPTPTTEGRFGISISISGKYMLVGAYRENSSGKAYIFDMTSGDLIHTLVPDTIEGVDPNFGYSVSIDGNYAVVGARGADDPDTGTAAAGMVFVYDVTTGNLLYKITNPTTPVLSYDYFGADVSVSGKYVVVGGSEGTGSNGGLYIFDASNGNLLTDIDNPNPYGTPSGDFFGFAVAMFGNYIIAGAELEDDGGDSSGKAYIFDVRTGALIYTLNNPNMFNTAVGDRFGHDVAISGNYAIVSAIFEKDSTGYLSGAVYIFKTVSGDWSDTTLLHSIIDPNTYGTRDGDVFGSSVAISGNYAIVGASDEDIANHADNGKAYIFDVVTGQLIKTLANPSVTGSDTFGNAVAISGNYIAVGAQQEDNTYTNSGAAYLYRISQN